MPLLVSLLSDCGRSVPLPRLWLGEPLAPFRRNGEQGGGAQHAIASRSGEAGGLEVTPPQADELWNDRRDTSKSIFVTKSGEI